MDRDTILSKYLEMVKNRGPKIRRQDFTNGIGITRSKLEQQWDTFTHLKDHARKHHPHLFKDEKDRDIVIGLEKIKELYLQKGRMPKTYEAEKAGISTRTQHKMGGIRKIEQKLRESFPDIFPDKSLKSLKTKHHVVSTHKKISKYKRLFIVTAVSGARVVEDFYSSIKSYCKLNDAALVILIAEDPAKQTDHEGQHLIDKSLINPEDIIIVSDCSLNDNIHIRTIKLSAKQLDATTGLDRLAGVGSFIYASPKQRLKPIPVGNTKHVHLLITTGAITEADYYSEMYMSKRLEYIAEFDHKIGGLIVEIEDNEIYHHRHVQADEDGSFIDMAIRYNSDGSSEFVGSLSLWPGDWHTGSTCPMVRACIKDMVNRVKPKYFFLNDFFDGKSINHHIKDNIAQQTRLADKGLLNLERELTLCAEELEDINKWGQDKTYLVYSNHDDFLSRYLDSARYAQRDQVQNHRLALKLALPYLDGENPIEHFCREIYGMSSGDMTIFLKEDDDLRLAGILHSAHGHLGANGSRATSCNSLEKVYHSANLGHNHGSEILRNIYRAGTSTYLKLDYNKGPSSWSNSHIITYMNGSRQLIYTICGKYMMDMEKVY